MKTKMKLKTMTLFFAMLLGFAVMFIGAEATHAIQQDENGVYQIKTYGDLQEFADIVNGGHTGARAVLSNSIDCGSEPNWTPIGNYGTPYKGTFDGCNNTIKALNNSPSGTSDYQGLFGFVGSNGVVQNVGLVGSHIRGNNYVGGVAGVNVGTITNCYNTGTVSGSGNKVGGVVGENEGTITNCYNSGSISGSEEQKEQVGGVAGHNKGKIVDCYNTGSVGGSNSAKRVGGVVGNNDNEGKIINCYNTGIVCDGTDNVGGVVGFISSGKITNCYNTGSVSGERAVGGVVGFSSGGATNSCYNTGDVNGITDHAGGVTGYIGYVGKIINCYNIGSVSSGSSNVGGVAGGNDSNGTMNYCYYDNVQCGNIGAVSGSDYKLIKVYGLPTEDMTGMKALENMEFVYGTGETSPWMTKDDGAGFWYYPHLEGFNFNKQGEQMKPGEISADYWPPKTAPVQRTVATPAFNPAAGSFGPSQSVSIGCSTEGATIYYTIDGTTPTTSSSVYTEAITVSNTTTIKAIAVKERWSNSEIASSTYTHAHKYGAWTKLNATQHQRVCQYDKSHVEKANHKWDAGKVTKKATEKATGVKTYTCTVCKATKTETIPKLKAKVSGVLTAKATAKGETGLAFKWNRIRGVAGYDIFFAICAHKGEKTACKKIMTIKGNKTFTWTKTGLKKNTGYKTIVKAYVMKDGKKSYVRTSPMMHAYTGGQTKNYTNAKSVTVNKTKVSLKKGKTFKIKAKVNKVNRNKKLMPKGHAPTLRYMTSNKKIATVSSGGKITAKGKGTCYVYVIAHNGMYKQIKVTVK